MEDTKINLLKSVVTGALVMTLLSILPLINAINIFCCSGIIIGGFAGVVNLNKQLKNANYVLKYKDAVLTGLFAGLISAVIMSGYSVIMMFYTSSNPVEEMTKLLEGFNISASPDISRELNKLSDEFNKYGYSPTLAIVTVISNLIIYPMFGAAGALLATSVLKRKN